MPLYTKKNWAKGYTSDYIDEFATVVEIQLGHTLPFDGSFPLVIWDQASYPDPGDDPNREIIVASFVGQGSGGGDLYAIVRGTDDTSANQHGSGSRVALNITAGIGYADLGIVGTQEVDESDLADTTALVYDVLFKKLRYKPIMVGFYDNDLNLYLMLGASNLNMYNVEFIAVVEYVKLQVVMIDVYEETFVWENLDLSLDLLNVDVGEIISVIETVDCQVVQIGVSDDLVVSEDIQIVLDVLSIDVNDLIFVIETVDFSGGEFSIGDNVGIAENIQLDLSLEFGVADPVSVAEDFAYAVV